MKGFPQQIKSKQEDCETEVQHYHSVKYYRSIMCMHHLYLLQNSICACVCVDRLMVDREMRKERERDQTVMLEKLKEIFLAFFILFALDFLHWAASKQNLVRRVFSFNIYQGLATCEELTRLNTSQWPLNHFSPIFQKQRADSSEFQRKTHALPWQWNHM